MLCGWGKDLIRAEMGMQDKRPRVLTLLSPCSQCRLDVLCLLFSCGAVAVAQNYIVIIGTTRSRSRTVLEVGYRGPPIKRSDFLGVGVPSPIRPLIWVEFSPPMRPA